MDLKVPMFSMVCMENFMIFENFLRHINKIDPAVTASLANQPVDILRTCLFDCLPVVYTYLWVVVQHLFKKLEVRGGDHTLLIEEPDELSVDHPYKH